MNITTKRCGGISLVDLVIGIALLTIVMLGAFLSLKSLGQGRGALSVSAKVSNKLRTIAEQIRYEAGTRFDSAWDRLPGGTEDRTENFDTNIQVSATYSTISPVTRSRKVTLVATWRDPMDPPGASLRTKTMTMEVTRVQNKMLGAVVAGRILKVGTSEGLPGVEVQAQSMDTGAWVPPIPRVTDADGYFEPIAGAYVGASPGARLRIDGSKVLAYHPAVNKADRKFMRDDLNTGSETRVGVTNGYRVNYPIEMVSVGAVVGYVKDPLAGNAGIGNVTVKLLVKDLTLPETYFTPSTLDTTTTTVSTGRFEFHRVVPGDYFLAVYGNNSYAAPVRENDYFNELGNTDFFTVDPDEVEDRGNSFTTRRGSISGQVFRVDWDGGSSVLKSDDVPYKEPSVAVKFDISRNVISGYHDAAKLNPGFNFVNTNAWQNYWKPLIAEVPVTTVSGDYTVADFMPIMIHRDVATYAANLQFSTVRIEPTEDWMPSPFSPVRVVPNAVSPTWPLTAAQVKFIFTERDNGKLATPAGTALTLFNNIRVFANDTSPAPNKAHFLNRNAFGTLSGDIRYATGGNPFLLDSGGPGTVTTRWGWAGNVGGTGGLEYSGALVRIAKYLGVASTLVGGTSHTYAFPAMTIPPNLGGNQTVVDFSKTDNTAVSKTFIGAIEGVRKVLNGTNIEFQPVPANDMDVTLKVRAYRLYSNWYQRWYEPSFGFQDGQFGSGGGGYNNVVDRSVSYTGSSAPTVIQFGTAETATILVSSSPASFQKLHLRVITAVNDQWGLNWSGSGNLTMGPVFAHDIPSGTYQLDPTVAGNNQNLSVFRRIYTTVNGSAIDSATGAPIANATIRIMDRDWQQQTVTTASNGTFTFTARYVTPYPGWNVVIRFDGHPDYNGGDWVYREVFESGGSTSLTINLPPFSMTKRPTGGGNTGGGGQGGSG